MSSKKVEKKDVAAVTLTSCAGLVQNVGAALYGQPVGVFIVSHGPDGFSFCGNMEADGLIDFLHKCIAGIEANRSEFSSDPKGMN